MTKGEQARLTAWRLKVLRQAADEGRMFKPVPPFCHASDDIGHSNARYWVSPIALWGK